MRQADQTVDSISGLINLLRRDVGTYQGPVWYRGQRDEAWRLEPKLLRGGGDSSRESHLINRFKQNAAMLVDRVPPGEFDWLFLMQHHGLPTRLLDWSENPLVGLYFAVVDHNSTEDSAVWVLLPTELNVKASIRPAFVQEVPSFDDDILMNYKPTVIAAENKSHLNPVAAIAPRNSLRMQAQQAVFTISHRDNVLIDASRAIIDITDHVWRYVIPVGARQSIREDLTRIGFSKFQLFPELSSIVDILK
jgi:hypothetical protein